MKSLSKKTNQAIGKDEQFNKLKGVDPDEDGTTVDASGGKQGAKPRGSASMIMQAVAKAVQNTPGKSGKKATKAGSQPTDPTSPVQKKMFKRSSKSRVPIGSKGRQGAGKDPNAPGGDDEDA